MDRDSTRQRSQGHISMSRRRTLIAQQTRLQPLPDLPTVRLYLAEDVEPVWQATDTARGRAGGPIPFWAYAWAGGIGLARYLLEHPDEVAGRTVLDIATGSGLCAIAAMQAGASGATGADVDPFAELAVAMNARANRVRVGFTGRDLLESDPPDVDVVLAGDTWYEARLSERIAPWLTAAAEHGSRVLIGDPGRRYLPMTGLQRLATYEVRTTTRLEDRDIVPTGVFALTDVT
ncbi:MAG: 50S ribosomal protein L11 methyltransferase [Chloroflexota bacterium]